MNILTICDRKNMTEEILRNLKPEILYISRVETLENLKDKIVDLKKLKNFYSKNCTIQNIRLYKLKDITWENAILPLIENCKVIRESDQLIKYDKLIYLEGKILFTFFYIFSYKLFFHLFLQFLL